LALGWVDQPGWVGFLLSWLFCLVGFGLDLLFGELAFCWLGFG